MRSRLRVLLLVTLAAALPARASPPAVTGFTPQNGTVGTLVKIVGFSLDSVTTVRFNGVESESVGIISSTHIKALVPRRATSGPVEVSGHNGRFETDVPFLVEPPGGIRLAFSRPRPNPARGGVAWRFSLMDPGRVRLAIYSVRGYHVRTLFGDFAFPGVQELRWDGRDRSGARVPAGVYCGRLEAAGRSARQCVTLVW